MSQEIEDEQTSINSIYGENTLVQIGAERLVYTLIFPSQPEVSLRVEFPGDYPDAPPSILGTQSVGSDIAKGEGASFVDLVRDVLSDIYSPGTPCIFDLIEEMNAQLQRLDNNLNENNVKQDVTQVDNQQQEPDVADHIPLESERPLDLSGEPPPWTLSEVITEKKSVFVARSAPVVSVEQAKKYLTHLLADDKKVAKATHNITAWRIRGEHGVQYQDCDDDGETAAGSRLLHLLELMGIWNAMVVVSRWYGGVHLGPDRFRIINQTARDALAQGGFAQDIAKDNNKKKGKK